MPLFRHQLISSNSKTWNGFVRQRRHVKYAELERLQERVWETRVKASLHRKGGTEIKYEAK